LLNSSGIYKEFLINQNCIFRRTNHVPEIISWPHSGSVVCHWANCLLSCYLS